MAGIDQYTKLMLHMNGTDASTTFTDDSGSSHTMTAQGNAQIDTAQKKFGTASGLLDGSGDYLSTPDSTDWAFGSGDFTIDAWVRFTDVSQPNVLIGRTTSGSSYLYWQLTNGSDGSRLADYDSGYNIDFKVSPSFSNNTWYHVALTRSGNNFRMFVDGTQVGSTYTNSNAFVSRTVTFDVGAMTQNSSYYMHGWIDELRVSKGIARWTSNFTPPTEEYSDSETVNFSESITLSDSWEVNSTHEDVSLSETINITDGWDISAYTPFYYAKKIIQNDDYLYFVTYTSPAQIIRIDITNPSNPVKNTYDITGYNNAVNFSLNTSNNYFYVAVDSGKVIKIKLSDLTDQTEIDTLETDSFVVADTASTQLKTIVSTDDSDGEIVMIDEKTLSSLNADLRWAVQTTKTIQCQLNTINGEKINCDLRYTENVIASINTDLRWLKYSYDSISKHPIDYSNIHVIVNGTDLTTNNGVDLSSIKIIHTKGSDSNATFTIYTRHDNPNGKAEITNNNSVEITINGQTEFNGNVTSFHALSENETIQVTATMDEPDYNKNNVSIPLTSIGSNIHLYDCLVDNISNTNESLDTRAIIINNDNLYYTGSSWSGDKNKANIYSSFASANHVVENMTDYTSQEAWPVPYKDPKYYKGVMVNLGTHIWRWATHERYEQSSVILGMYHLTNVGDTDKTLVDRINNGTFSPDQNWEYFWWASFDYFALPNQSDRPDLYKFFNNPISGLKYLGTSLASLTTDAWEITDVKAYKQQKFDEITTDKGWYYVGDAPYKIISTQNGKKSPYSYYEDRNDGLYFITSDWYDYIDYAKDIADLEYSKLKTINDEILPITSADIQLTLNGYYFYGINLLTRINISNTTSSNIYNGNNGFPVSVKTITLNTSDMTVTCSCNNQFSSEELDDIDENRPDVNSDKYIHSEITQLVDRKFDPNEMDYIT